MHHYTPEEIAYLREVIPVYSTHDVQALFMERFGVALTVGQLDGVRQRYGIKPSTDGRFKPGFTPHNKGRKWTDYMTPEGIEGARATQFKPGILPKNSLPVGAERVSKDGYIEVHISAHRRNKPGDSWISKHRYLWEQAHHCEVPQGHVVIFADGNNRNFDLENLVCVSRSDLLKMNQYHLSYYDRETLEIALDIVHLKGAAHKAELKAKGKE